MIAFSFNKQNLPVEFIIHVLHFLRLHQVVYQLTLVLTILFFHPQADLFAILSAIVLIILITPTFLLVQDVLGKQDDIKANQKRLLFSAHTNKVFFYASVTLMLLILLLNNFTSLVCYGLLFVSTLGYATAKHYRKMLVSYTCRYLSSVFTVLLYIFLLAGGLFQPYYPLIILVSVLDLVGNIAGDIRDSDKDSKAGIKTLVTISDKSTTLQIMSFFILCVFGLIVIHFQSIILLIILVANVSSFVIIEQLQVKYSHAIFHLGKLLNFIALAGFLTAVPIVLFLLVAISVSIVWSLAYYFYLLNTGLSSHA